ncbi:MAG: single-stranded-DNA-specific exonuclease [Thermoproteota archaeon]|nr:single-stranded-DNA-specific exonuclease [Thermoproteota archaeon]
MAEKAQNRKDFKLSVTKAAEIIKENIEKGKSITLISHVDADGLAAASIMGKALAREEAFFRIRIWKQMDELLVEEIASEEKSLLVFSDLGSGNLDLLSSKLPEWDIVVLDHHQLIGKPSNKLIHVNPHNNSFDGAREISGAGVTYFTAKAMNELNVDHASLAVVGALGDSQDKNDKKKLFGLNEEIANDAVNAGYLKIETDLIFYGRETRPVHKALAYTTNPFIPDLSGEEDKCYGFLSNLGIKLKNEDRWRTINDLNIEEKQKIFSELAKYLSSKRLPNTIAFSLIGTVYTLIKEDRWTPLRDAREYSSLLNACGRMSKSGLGIEIGMGNLSGSLDEAKEEMNGYRKTLAEYMDWMTKTPKATEELGNIYVINGMGVIDELMLGTIASIVSTSGFFNENKPIIALTSTETGMIKVSGRIPNNVLDKKLNLGTIFDKASTQFSGSGGGHDVAAGAQLPQGLENEFIKLIDQMIGAVKE